MKKVVLILILIWSGNSFSQNMVSPYLNIKKSSTSGINAHLGYTDPNWNGVVLWNKLGDVRIKTSGSEYHFNSNGNFGVGLTNPIAGLDVKNNEGIKVQSIVNGGWRGTIKMVDGFTNQTSRDDMLFSTSGGFMFKMDENKNGISNVSGFNIYNRNDESVFTIVEKNGRVGIGKNDPSQKLDINGNIGGRYYYTTDGNATGALFTYSGNQDLYLGAGKDKDGNKNNITLYNYSCIGGCNVPKINLLADLVYIPKKVGVGTNTTGSHSLAVEGSIGAREIKVEVDTWSDFVFEDDYNLPSLKEVEGHIKSKGHLKGIPSAKEVEENGIDLGEMNAKLLQKIEELTLYTIEQQKQISVLKESKKEVEVLSKQLMKLQKAFDELK